MKSKLSRQAIEAMQRGVQVSDIEPGLARFLCGAQEILTGQPAAALQADFLDANLWYLGDHGLVNVETGVSGPEWIPSAELAEALSGCRPRAKAMPPKDVSKIFDVIRTLIESATKQSIDSCGGLETNNVKRLRCLL